jgi:hypothetical protein
VPKGGKATKPVELQVSQGAYDGQAGSVEAVFPLGNGPEWTGEGSIKVEAVPGRTADPSLADQQPSAVELPVDLTPRVLGVASEVTQTEVKVHVSMQGVEPFPFVAGAQMSVPANVQLAVARSFEVELWTQGAAKPFALPVKFGLSLPASPNQGFCDDHGKLTVIFNRLDLEDKAFELRVLRPKAHPLVRGVKIKSLADAATPVLARAPVSAQPPPSPTEAPP